MSLLHFDTLACKKNDTKVGVALVLAGISLGYPVKQQHYKEALEKGYIKCKFSESGEVEDIWITEEGRSLFSKIAKDFNHTDDEWYMKTVEGMRECYPAGAKKDKYGRKTPYQWRGNTKNNAQRLKSILQENGYKPSDELSEKCINATKRYVESFHEDFLYMNLLEYFIYKQVDGKKSQLISYLENESDDEDDSLECPLMRN
jgi:hypothetical protein